MVAMFGVMTALLFALGVLAGVTAFVASGRGELRGRNGAFAPKPASPAVRPVAPPTQWRRAS
jgi:hypothetical protein